MLKQRNQPEVELVSRLSDQIRKDWDEVYHSVRFLDYEIDLVAVRMRGGELQTLCVEAKGRMCPELFGKALMWADWSTYVMVAAPDWNACVAVTRFSIVGIDAKGKSRACIHTGAKPDAVLAISIAARKSSTGLIAPGGAKSPIKATPAHILAEKILKAWKAGNVPMLSVREVLPDCSDDELKGAVKVLRGTSEAPTVRDWKNDWLLVR